MYSYFMTESVQRARDQNTVSNDADDKVPSWLKHLQHNDDDQ